MPHARQPVRLKQVQRPPSPRQFFFGYPVGKVIAGSSVATGHGAFALISHTSASTRNAFEKEKTLKTGKQQKATPNRTCMHLIGKVFPGKEKYNSLFP